MAPYPLVKVLHSLTHLASRMFGGSYGRVPAVTEPERTAVTVPGAILSCLRWSGPPGVSPIVLLHGLNNNAWAWARVATLLCPERTVLSVSLRGHGHSRALDGSSIWDISTLANDILSLMDALALPVVHLAGHSLGGKVACKVASTVPRRIATLTLADPVPPRGFNKILRTFPALVDAALRPERGPFKDGDSFVRAMAVPVYLSAHDDTDTRLWGESFIQGADGSYHHTLPEEAYLALLHNALNEDLSHLRCDFPVLLMRPTLSVAFLPWEVSSMRHQFPKMVVKRVLGDHSFIHSNPYDTAAVMKAFLDRH